MQELNGFTVFVPAGSGDETEQETTLAFPGVFVIARHHSVGSAGLEFLYCGEAENIRAEAQAVMTRKAFDGFERPVFYLVLREPSFQRRTASLASLKSLGMRSE
jgi:hypothetical protein